MNTHTGEGRWKLRKRTLSILTVRKIWKKRLFSYGRFAYESVSRPDASTKASTAVIASPKSNSVAAAAPLLSAPPPSPPSAPPAPPEPPAPPVAPPALPAPLPSAAMSPH